MRPWWTMAASTLWRRRCVRCAGPPVASDTASFEIGPGARPAPGRSGSVSRAATYGWIRAPLPRRSGGRMRRITRTAWNAGHPSRETVSGPGAGGVCSTPTATGDSRMIRRSGSSAKPCGSSHRFGRSAKRPSIPCRVHHAVCSSISDAGTDTSLRIMRDLGWTVQGLEPDPKAAAFARAYGLDIIQSPIERASLPFNAFDVITTSHVIEHVLEPVTFLSLARRALRPDGLLYVFTPNAESWGHAMFGPSWYPLEPPRHLHIFRPRNLVACAERAGLQVVDVRTTGRLHLFFDASVSIHKTGQYRFDDPTIHASVFDRLFRVTENLLVHVHPYAGEEIVMRCTNAARG